MPTATDKKLRHSKLRNEIYEYLCSTKEHPTAETVYEALRLNNPNISLGTVYRNLSQLESLGMITRVTNVGGHERYDANCRDHAHFVCDCCYRVIDLPDADIGAVRNACHLLGDADLRRISIVMGGLCDKCAKH